MNSSHDDTKLGKFISYLTKSEVTLNQDHINEILKVIDALYIAHNMDQVHSIPQRKIPAIFKILIKHEMLSAEILRHLFDIYLEITYHGRDFSKLNVMEDAVIMNKIQLEIMEFTKLNQQYPFKGNANILNLTLKKTLAFTDVNLEKAHLHAQSIESEYYRFMTQLLLCAHQSDGGFQIIPEDVILVILILYSELQFQAKAKVAPRDAFFRLKGAIRNNTNEIEIKEVETSSSLRLSH